MRGAPHQRRSEHLAPVGGGIVDDDGLCWLSVLVGAVSEELLKEGSPVLLLWCGRLIFNAGVGGNALILPEVIFLDGCCQFLSHSQLECLVQGAKELPHLAEGLVVAGRVPRRKDKHLPSDPRYCGVSAAQILKSEVDNFH